MVLSDEKVNRICDRMVKDSATIIYQTMWLRMFARVCRAEQIPRDKLKKEAVEAAKQLCKKATISCSGTSEDDDNFTDALQQREVNIIVIAAVAHKLTLEWCLKYMEGIESEQKTWRSA